MATKSQLQLKIQKINRIRQGQLMIKTRVFHELLMFMDYKIRKQVKTFSILSLCGGERNKFMVDVYFENAFSELSAEEKVHLYETTVEYAVQFQKSQSLPAQSRVQVIVQDDSRQSPEKKKPITFRIEIHKGFRSWSVIYLSLDDFKLASENVLQIDLRNYLLRKSKKTERECYALQAIHQTEPQIIRFGFLSNSDRNQYLPVIQELIDRGYREMLKRMLNVEICSSSSSNGFLKMRPPKLTGSDSIKQTVTLSKSDYRNEEEDCRPVTSKFTLPVDHKQSNKKQSQLQAPSVVQQMLKHHEEQYLNDELANIIDEQNQKARHEEELLEESKIKNNGKEVAPKYHKNVFAIIFPYYHLEGLDHFPNFKLIYNNTSNGTCIFQNNDNHRQFKMKIQPKVDTLFALRTMINVPLYKHWHPEIVHGHINLRISSENSAIVYQKHKAYSKWYRERDFLYLRHVFKKGENFFIADKSIQNSNFIPFQTIQRGTIVYQIVKIAPWQNGCRIMIQCQIEHGGLLNQGYMQQLTQRYLQGFQQIEPFYQKNEYHDPMIDYFRTDWTINQNYSPQSSSTLPPRDNWEVQSIDFIQQQISCSFSEEDLYFSIKDESQRLESEEKSSIHELLQQEFVVKQKQNYMRNEAEVIEVDDDGLIILPKTYLKIRHPKDIMQDSSNRRITLKYDDFLRKNQWIVDQSGGFVLINKQIIAAQDNVLSFIMSTLKKNIFSGKAALNISLPVTIFNCDSNLQRLCFGLALAPDYLEKAAGIESQAERMKYCFIFGLTNSLFFFDIQKPFNPILGQTYQGFIAGCPVYAEQVSHHPPVTAIYLIGRGYKVYASIQGTVNVYINSANGINLGWYHIVFDDGQQVCFQTPPAQFTGLALGQRKFNFKEKGYYFDKANQFYGQMKFQDQSGIFSNKKWKFKDQFEVELHKVTQQFLNKFISNFPAKKVTLSKKDILDSCFKLEGRWPFNIFCNGKVLYSVNDNLAYELIDYQYPLNSNSNYREDLFYRKKNDLSRSQSEKERLEIIQRQDRKFREMYTGKQKH